MANALSKALAHAGELAFYLGCLYIALLLFQRRRWLGSLLTAAIATVWLLYFTSVANYLKELGEDSFAEAGKFEWAEASFWLSTIESYLYASPVVAKFALFTAAAGASFWAMHALARRIGMDGHRFRLAVALIAVTLMAAGIQHTTRDVVASYAENSRQSLALARNFHQAAPEMTPAASGLDLVVYIGESTTVMNMGLYGYPRNTTPRLSALARSDPGLVVFRNVFSTQTLTSQSLLEALSVAVDPAEDAWPISRRRRVPVVALLDKAGVESTLVSIQPMGGLWNQSSTAVFRNSAHFYRTQEVRAAMLRGEAPPGRWDDEFFEWELRRLKPAVGPRVLFLHSYAGHGEYEKYVPPAFHVRVDDALTAVPPGQVAHGADARTVQSIEQYDAAVRYVDYSVSREIERVARSPRPGVLVYFSDHGESVFKQRGHDSARFAHEMVRIPFILYFNEAARARAPALLAKYQALAARGDIATLAQLPSTLLDLVGTRPAGASHPALLPVVGDKVRPGPIVVRQTQQGVTHVSLDPDAPTPATDADTRTFLAVHLGRAPPVCDPEPATFEELARGILVSGCKAGHWPRLRAAMAPAER